MSDAAKENGKSWYEVGWNGVEKEAERKELGRPPQNFWQKAGSTKQVVPVDDVPFCFRQHGWKDYNGDWQNATCLQGIDPNGCPLDGVKGIGRSDLVGMLTIVDIDGYVGKNGEQKYLLQALPAQTTLANKIKVHKEMKRVFAAQLWALGRASDRQAMTGEELSHVREVKMDELYKVVNYKGKLLKTLIDTANNVSPEGIKARRYLSYHFQIPEEGEIPAKIPAFNYKALYAPRPATELKALAATSGKGTSFRGAVTEDVPF